MPTDAGSGLIDVNNRLVATAARDPLVDAFFLALHQKSITAATDIRVGVLDVRAVRVWGLRVDGDRCLR